MAALRNAIKCFLLKRKNNVRYQDEDSDPVEYLVLEDRKLVFIVVSKVACTSIKSTMGKSYGITALRDSGLDIHRHPAWLRQFRDLDKRYQHFYTFAFVRNPLARLVSCYRDRVIYRGPNQDFPEYYFKDYPFTIPANCSFSEFVRVIEKIPDALADRHFKSQSASLYKHSYACPDFVGCFERLNEDWRFLAEKFAFDEVVAHRHSSQSKDPARAGYEMYYDKDTLQRVHKRYARDFTFFDYEHTYQLLLKSLSR